MVFRGRHIASDAFTPDRIEVLNILASQAAISIENALLYQNLEQKVQERTAQLRQKTRDIQSMLQNMRQGIFTVVQDLTIHEEYSVHLEEILETKQIAKTEVMQTLFANSNIGSDRLDQNKVALGSIIGEDDMMFEINCHLLITEFKKIHVNGGHKILELDWEPIPDENDVIEKIMVIVRDVTELRDLQTEAQKQKQELEIIGHILSVPIKTFQDFIKSSLSFIQQNRDLIRQSQEKDSEVIGKLFRHMHTLKGNARTYGFDYLTNTVHDVEQQYDELRKNNEAQWNQAGLLKDLDKAHEAVKQYQNLSEEKLQRGRDTVTNEEKALVDHLNRLSQETDLTRNESRIDFAENVVKAFNILETDSLEDIVGDIINSLSSLTEELGKPVPEVNLIDNQIRFSTDITPVLRDIFTHCIRNSVDHGIESPEKRCELGKKETGTISIKVMIKDDCLSICLKDDGAGLNLPAIRKKGRENDLIDDQSEPSDENIANLIFGSGVSTAEAVTTVSGRGVGMDAIKEFLKDKGGSIRIQFTGETAATGYRPFESIIELPKMYAICV